MENSKRNTTSSYNRRSNRKKKYYETNSKNIEHSNSYECNTYKTTFIPTSYSYFEMTSVLSLYKPEHIRDLIRDPMAHNRILREISRMLYGCNGILTNTIDYMTAMPTLDNVVVQYGDSKQKRKKNKALMQSTLKKIKHKEIVRDALCKGMIDGVAFYYFETTERPYSRTKIMSDYDVERIVEINEAGINVSIISLPVDYTRIIGIKNSSYQLAFDMSYFDNCEGEIAEKKLRKYPKEIRDAYNKGNRHNWVVLDTNKTIVHKIRSNKDEPWGRPLALGAINDILYGDYFTDTKRGVLDEINNRIIYQTFPEGDKKGMTTLSEPQQINQHEKVKAAVISKNNRGGISFFSVAAGTKINAIQAANTDIFDDKYESNLSDKIAMDLGIASSLLNGSGSGNYSSQVNNLQLLSSQLFQWIEQIENELNKCINENIIKDKKNYVMCKYLTTTYVNQKDMVGYAKDLYLQGKGSLALWASAAGISPEVYFALLDQELEDDIENKYPTHQTSFTLTSKDAEPGRPTDDDSGNYSTLQTKATNSNSTPAPSTQ